MLNFIGTGSAFHTDLGNNSAYHKQLDTLLLIDCGGSVFHRLMSSGLLEGVKSLNVIITHTHPDHVGSLGDLIFYGFYVLKIKVRIFFPDQDWMENCLKYMGVQSDQYILEHQLTGYISPEMELTFVPVEHLPTVPTYGVLLTIGGKTLYYSGDASNIPTQVLNLFLDGGIEALYQDTSGLDYDDNPHLSLLKLQTLIPEALRHRVFCMHLDRQFDRERGKALGFSDVLDLAL